VSPSPIGIFDSGLGGLSVLREVRALLPHETLLYLADSRYAPYGDKPLQACEWLAAQGCKALVVACNTATAHGIQALRERLTLPIVGVEPGLKPAVAASRSKVVGVLATANTLASDKFARLLHSLEDQCRFVCQPGGGLVARIEQGDVDGPQVRERLQTCLAPMLEAGADTLVLGCTHYPFLSETVRKLIGERMTLIDTGVAVARQLQRKLAEHGLAADAEMSVTTGVKTGVERGANPIAVARYCTTSDAEHLRRMARALLHVDAAAETVVIEPAPISL